MGFNKIYISENTGPYNVSMWLIRDCCRDRILCMQNTVDHTTHPIPDIDCLVLELDRQLLRFQLIQFPFDDFPHSRLPIDIKIRCFLLFSCFVLLENLIFVAVEQVALFVFEFLKRCTP